MTEKWPNDRASAPIFLLHSCDAAGGNRRLMLATVHRMRLKKACVRAIHNDLIEYRGSETGDKSQQLKQFRKDFEALPLEKVNQGMRFGIMTVCRDGEEM